jgi:hypothetical protein
MEQLTLPNTTTFMAWYDPDKKYKLKRKVADALERYEEKFGKPATLILTHPEHVVEARQATEIAIEGRSYIGRFTFYVGEE